MIYFAGMVGWWPPRLCAEVKWNRTANVVGGWGNNLELDLINEFLNADFKGINHANFVNILKNY